MTDTKKLIEEARKLAEQQREQELVKEALEVFAADPAPSINVTPQQFLDRLVAAVKKVDAKKANANLKVQSISGQQVDLSGMDGSIDDKLLPSLKFIESTFETTANVNTKLEGKADKAFESIKDISSATTQAEVYALLEVGKTYNWHGSIIRCFDKQPSQAMVRGFGVTNTNEFAMIGIWVHNTADPFTITVPADLDRLSVYTPSGDNHAANKKYVDDKAPSKTLTLHFDDNTTEDIKVG